MENIQLTCSSQAHPPALAESVLCGVVSSGNLEILVYCHEDQSATHFNVHTAAHGFTDIWHAVLQDFAQRHRVGGLAFDVNDAGATPAVVSLRLDQAFHNWCQSQ
ncbi:MAG: malonate decarboxylase acyl carrier protein [Ferrovum sp. 37-45-19]|uniref:malonate decarboxylase acyl carrier protein n=1 Tax=Ferrovum sp. JA12 TaxID=1356299 RepID=UPI00070260D1|nr:malonate decarboxylase acyl carrier protein [Ferrovum sp. JA12]OYV80042.1 MAG: malonate decarboxylase acyl carrier protein [Ferrovum sp. 21-44-67]OYV93637.1 MAG: malonate decarboxylase acyl carrier protein [Ferrovum sp. 37-45-19]OZB33468.1 MAG: malonate decarboxylase acyl carrier protein [Ferrovum sp. 34-44-207]HQT81919.1 malonate decarboxylase acyl carrier protein [Ferrovaceae bacterium]KRH78041.1 malonate decarboxylase acyl carrier protein [Ferrovum sp. JA12]